MTTKARWIAIGAVLVAAALAGCAQDGGNGTDGGGGGGGQYDVAATGASDFEPRNLTISVGETVTWENTAGYAHTATSYDVPSGASSFDSGNLDGGQTFSHTFQTQGTFKYRCEYHSSSSDGGYSGMVGKVVVQA